MILTETQFRYLAELPATVAHSVPGAPNPDVPFFLDDPVIQDYELLRSVWAAGEAIHCACRRIRRSRTEFYKLEYAFLHHGIAAVFPSMGRRQQHPKLERLALLVKTTRPQTTELTILRLAEALGLDPLPSLRTIGHLLHCHGFGNTRDENDREYWRGIQESVRAITWLKEQPGPPRDNKNRKNTFYDADEPLQLRFELFRELALRPDAKVGETARRYGLSPPTYYKYLNRFRTYGAWGLVDWLQPGRGRGAISPDLEVRILEEKLEHPRLSLADIMNRMKLKCSRSSVY